MFEEISIFNGFIMIWNLTQKPGVGWGEGRGESKKAKRKKKASSSERRHSLQWFLLFALRCFPGRTNFCCRSGPTAPLLSHADLCHFCRWVYIAECRVTALGQTSSEQKGQTRFHITSCFSTERWVCPFPLVFVFLLILMEKKKKKSLEMVGKGK